MSAPIPIRRARPFSPLFLGGPWHGQRRELPEPMSDIIVPVPRPPQRVFSIVDPESRIDEIPELQTVRYELTKLAWPKAHRIVALYFPAGYSDADKEHAVADWLEGGA